MNKIALITYALVLSMAFWVIQSYANETKKVSKRLSRMS